QGLLLPSVKLFQNRINACEPLFVIVGALWRHDDPRRVMLSGKHAKSGRKKQAPGQGDREDGPGRETCAPPARTADDRWKKQSRGRARAQRRRRAREEPLG